MSEDSLPDGKKSESSIPKGIVALAIFTLLAGTSMAAGLEDFAAPDYAEDSWMDGVVDDATDDRGWDTIESDDRPIRKAAKELIHRMMPKRMDDRMDDRMGHLQDRMAAGQELVTAFQFCIEHAECTGDTDELQFMIDSINSRHVDMRAKIDAREAGELPEQRDRKMADDDEREVEDDEVRFDCRTYEFWTEEKQEWCDSHYNDDWHQWDGADRKASMLETASIAVVFCLESDDCTADAAALMAIHERMIDRHMHHMRDAMRLDRGDWDEGEARVMGDIEVSEEMCLERGGQWVTDGDASVCVWPEFDREGCDKDEDREDESEDERERDDPDSEDSEEDREEESNESSASQEDCEAAGGTWSEDRQQCY